MLAEQSSSHSHEAKSPFFSDTQKDYRWLHPTMSPMIPLTDLCIQFQDLPSFVHHPDFDHFAYCWMEFQYHIAMSQHPACRPGVKAWLVSMSVQLSNFVAKYPPSPSHANTNDKSDHEASAFHIKSAYKRLLHRFSVLHKLLDMIDHGAVVANQSPQEVVLPVYNALLEYKLDQQLYRHHPSPPPPSDSASLTSSSQWSSSSSSSGVSTPNVQLSLLSLSSPETASAITTSSFRSLSCMEVMPYLNNNCVSSPHIHPMSLILPPPNHFASESLTMPSYHHCHQQQSSSWSTPVTPSAIDRMPATMFWSSCPVSPLDPTRRRRCPSLPDSSPITATTPRSSMEQEDENEPLMPLPPDGQSANSLNDLTDYHDELCSEYPPSHNDEYDAYSPTFSKDDDPPPPPPPPPAKQRTKKRRQRRAILPSIASAEASFKIRHRQRGRTATSYDQNTTHFLKSMFFNVYSRREKLTKEQRRQVVERTGLKPRNVTYWFSNHKRRFQADLDMFRKLLDKNDGAIQTYDDYVAWRHDQGLPDDTIGDNDM